MLPKLQEQRWGMAVREVSTGMSRAQSNDGKWREWIEVQKAATRVWAEDDLEEAISIVNRFLAADPPVDLERQAIGFRGSLHQERGDLESARTDFLAARALSEGPDFERCTLEQSAGVTSQQLGDRLEAEKWFLEALKTAVAEPRAGGGGVVLNLLDAKGEGNLTAEERALCEGVIRGSWQSLSLEGEPELKDLAAGARKLLQAQSRA